VKRLYILPVVVALIMSFVSSRWLFVGSGLNLIPWGLLALSFGTIAKNKRDALWLGALYGFSQAFIFLWVDKAGSITFSQFLLLLVVITGLGIVAGGCGAVAARLSFYIKSRTSHKKEMG